MCMPKPIQATQINMVCAFFLRQLDVLSAWEAMANPDGSGHPEDVSDNEMCNSLGAFKEAISVLGWCP